MPKVVGVDGREFEIGLPVDRVQHPDSISIHRPGDPDSRPLYRLFQDGMKEVALPTPTRWQKLRAWWRGKTLPRTEMVPNMKIAIRGDMFVDDSILVGPDSVALAELSESAE